MEDFAQGLAEGIDDLAEEHFGKRMGFLLFFFDFGNGGASTYLSNGRRNECIQAMEELLERLKKKGFTGTTKQNNQEFMMRIGFIKEKHRKDDNGTPTGGETVGTGFTIS